MMWEILTQKSIFFTLGKGDQKTKKKITFKTNSGKSIFLFQNTVIVKTYMKEIEALKIPKQALPFSGFPAPYSGGTAKARAWPTAQNCSKFWLEPRCGTTT